MTDRRQHPAPQPRVNARPTLSVDTWAVLLALAAAALVRLGLITHVRW